MVEMKENDEADEGSRHIINTTSKNDKGKFAVNM